MGRNAFRRTDREANRLGEIEASGRLNALWSGRDFCRLAFFKTCCKTDIAMRSVDEYLVLRCQAQRECTSQKEYWCPKVVA